MAGAYEMLAADHDWMFDDDEPANGRAANLPAAAPRLLQRISRTSVVLDAACGTGVDAAVLARRAVGADGGQLAIEANRLICQSTGSGLCRCPTAAMELDSHLVVPGRAGTLACAKSARKPGSVRGSIWFCRAVPRQRIRLRREGTAHAEVN
jgi:hypothetical protein